MKRLKVTKKSVITAIYTVIALVTISLSILPGTNSKFLKDKENVLAYNSNLPEGYKGSFDLIFNEDDITNSSPKKIRLTIDFIRDREAKNESYTFSGYFGNDTSNTCSIISKDINGNDLYSSNITIENNIIKFNSAEPVITDEKVEHGTFKIECNVVENSDIRVNGVINELISEPAEEFIFRTGTFPMTIDTWPKPFTYEAYKLLFENATENNTINKNDENIYEKLISIIEKHLSTNAYAIDYKIDADNSQKYIDYLSHYGIVGNDTDSISHMISTDDKPFTVIEGITGICDNETCTYSFSPNFEGYVNNDYWHTIKKAENGINRIYFSAEDEASIEKMIDFVVNNYIYTINDKIDGKTYKELILKYVRLNINQYTISNLNSIKGFKIENDNYIINENEKHTYSFAELDNMIIYYAINNLNKNEVNNVIRVPQEGYVTIKARIYNEAIGLTYTGTVKEYLTRTSENKDLPLMSAIVCGATCKPYQKTIYDKDYNAYFVINVEPDNTNKINTITIDKIDTLNEITFNIEHSTDKESMKTMFNSSIEKLYSNSFEKYLTIETITDNALTEAITCNDNTCSEYREVRYDATSKKYYEILVKPETGINKVTVKEYNTFAEITNTNIISETMDNALNCTTGCKEFNEYYYNYKDSANEYVGVKVNADTDDANIKKVDINIPEDNELLTVLPDSEYQKFKYSINTSMKIELLKYSLICTTENCSSADYYEVHYIENEFIVIRVTHNLDKMFNSVTIEKSSIDNISQDCRDILSTASPLYVFMKNDNDDKILDFLVNDMGFSDDDDYIDTKDTDIKAKLLYNLFG